MQWDIVLRTLGTSALLLTALTLLRTAPRSAVARTFAPFALGIAGFLGVNAAFDAGELPAPLWDVASFCSRLAAAFLWLFCIVLFDGRMPAARLVAGVVGAWCALVVIDKAGLVPAALDPALSFGVVAFAVALVLHAGWRALRDLRGDLIDGRRRARPVFAFALLGLLAADLAADVVQGFGWRPAAFLMAQNATIAALSCALALWLLRATAWLAPPVATPAPAGIALPSDAHAPAADPDDALLARIDAVMRDARPYLEPELTFAQFAARVGIAEPALRRVINHRLGHGHFRSFLNGWRIEEAKRRLRDPASAGDKILAVALDSGFSSLASFNRVFRQAVGCTPSDYRAGAPGGAGA